MSSAIDCYLLSKVEIVFQTANMGFYYSMVDAIATLMSLTKYSLNSGGCCTMLALNVKNALNFSNWDQFKDASANIGIPGYLETR